MVQIFVEKKKNLCFNFLYVIFFWESNLYMNKSIWKLRGKWSNFVGNNLVGFRVVFLPDCPLTLSLLKYRGCKGIFEPKKIKIPNRRSPLTQFLWYIIIIYVHTKFVKEEPSQNSVTNY